MTALKVLVVGGGGDRSVELLQKISSLHAKQSFSIAIIVGDLFPTAESTTGDGTDSSDPSQADQDLNKLINGEIQLPLLTYFTLGHSPLPPQVIPRLQKNDGVLCENLEFLGKRTTLTTSDGIRIVALGGNIDKQLNAEQSKDNYLPFYCVGDANSLRGAKTADILITSDWPGNVRSGSSVPFEPSPDAPPREENCIAELAAAIKPRYHFSNTSTLFYEREPFFHPPEPDTVADGFKTTRFISVASFGNPEKKKWAYAFSIEPKAALPANIPQGCTPSPYQFLNKKRPRPQDNDSHSRWSRDNQHHHQRKKHKQPPPGPDQCFFCLGNPSVETHMLVAIGSTAYLATAKGPISTRTTFPQLPFPSHLLIVTIPHTPRPSAIASEAQWSTMPTEMKQFRSALNAMLLAKANGALGSVTWEVSRASGIHAHWQYVPVPAQLIEKHLVEAAFKKEAENDSYPAIEYSELSMDGDENIGDYLKVSIWRPPSPAERSERSEDDTNTSKEPPKGTETNIRLPLPSGNSSKSESQTKKPVFFDAQFPRRVLAKLLRLDDRSHWRDCIQTTVEETADTEAVKKAFEAFDFTT